MKIFRKIPIIILFITLAVAWSPSKIFPYVFPLIAVTLVLTTLQRSVFIRLSLITFLFLAWLILSFIFNDNFIFHNAILSIITYSSFLVFFLLPPGLVASHDLYTTVSKIILIVTILQAAIGLFQISWRFAETRSLDLNAGDVVEGTIHFHPSNATGFETPSFAANMIFSMLFLIPYAVERKRLTVASLVFCGFATLLSSVMHLFVFLVIAIAITLLINLIIGRVPKWLIGLIITVVFFSALVYYIMPFNVRVLLPRHIENIQENPKIIVFRRLFLAFGEHPQLPIIGFGPGQGVSRAAFIATGDYLREPIEKFGITKHTPNFNADNVITFWPGFGQQMATMRPLGSTLRPISSWLALFSEAGFTGVLLILIIIGRLIIKPIKDFQPGKINNPIFFSFRTGILFLFLMGFQEFYWEYPQAIFLGIVLLKILHGKLIASNRDDIHPGQK